MIDYGLVIYSLFIVLIILMIILKKKPILIGALGIIAVGIGETGDIFNGIQIAFRGLLFTATDLLPIILLIGLVVGMTNMLRETGTDAIIIKPFLRLNNPFWIYWLMGLFLCFFSLFLWPTPAVTLLGAVILPIISNTGINPLGLAVGLCIFGEGIGLAGDYIIQGAPGLLAKSAGISVSSVIMESIPMVLGSGLLASLIGFWKMSKLNEQRKDIRQGSQQVRKEARHHALPSEVLDQTSTPTGQKKRSILAILTVGIYGVTVIMLLNSGLRGDSAAAATGGITIILLILGSVITNYRTSLNSFVQYIQSGMRFSMEVFAPIVVIAGFFILGTENGNEKILQELGPGYLEQLSLQLSQIITLNELTCSLIMVFAAIIGAMSGSGFSALPLVGGVAAALGQASGIPVVQLAVLGQVAAIWTDATMIPWGFPAVVSAVTRTEAVHIVRQNILPWLSAQVFIIVWTLVRY